MAEPLHDRVRRLALIGSHGALNRTDQMRLAADALALLARVSHEESASPADGSLSRDDTHAGSEDRSPRLPNTL